jgi:hypothetical protein
LDDVELRTAGKKLAFAEIMIGPNQNPEEANARVVALLEEAGYKLGRLEYPEVTVSQLSDWIHETQKEEKGITTATA